MNTSHFSRNLWLHLKPLLKFRKPMTPTKSDTLCVRNVKRHSSKRIVFFEMPQTL